MKIIQHIAGDTWRRAWIIGGSANPIDITGSSARLHVREEKTDELILSAETPDKGLQITAVGGRIDLRFDSEEMQLDPKKTYIFDIEFTDADGVVRTLEQAKLKIIKDYTHG